MKKLFLSGGLVALIALLLALPSTCGPELLDTRDWDLSQLVRKVQENGLQVHVVPTRRSGEWGNTVYLTLDEQATWQTFQTKRRTVEAIHGWEGSVWLERQEPQSGTEWDVAAWGSNGAQLDRFVLFGDERLIQRILQSLAR